MREGDHVLIMFVVILAVSLAVLLFLLDWAFGEEYLAISPENQEHCFRYALVGNTGQKGYDECISVLPMRLPMPEPAGTVPATGTTWAEACAAKYKTWDASDGTVVRRGSPERVKCPLALVDGEWVLDQP